MLPNIHLLGIQGSGKGTQSSLLVRKFGLTYAASGDLFRQRAAIQDEFGLELTRELSTGRLLPNNLLFSTVEHFLSNQVISIGLLGDGVIRTAEQYEGLNLIWPAYGLDVPFLINLQLDEETALKRIEQRQRELEDPQKREHYMVYGGKALKRNDDNPQAIHERFKAFRRMTEPVIGIFEREGRCLHVDAGKSVEEIHADVCEALDRIYPALSNVAY